MNPWYVLPTISAPMPFQMALDELLFRRLEAGDPYLAERCPLLRFYYSSEPWMTVGYSYQREGAGSHPRICRRLTGGGEVLHGDDLIFAIIGRKEDDESFRSVRTSYWKIHEAVKWGFEKLGKDAWFYRSDENLPKGKDCFRYPIATDLALGDRKVAGGAQKRSGGFFLHEESIQHFAGIDWEDLTGAIQVGLERLFHARLEGCDFDPSWMKMAKALAREKYERA